MTEDEIKEFLKMPELPDVIYARPLRSAHNKGIAAVRPESPNIEQYANHESMAYTRFVKQVNPKAASAKEILNILICSGRLHLLHPDDEKFIREQQQLHSEV